MWAVGFTHVYFLPGPLGPGITIPNVDKVFSEVQNPGAILPVYHVKKKQKKPLDLVCYEEYGIRESLEST